MSHFLQPKGPLTHQAPLSMGFSRQEYWNGLLFPPPGAFADPGIELMSVMSPVLAGAFFTTSHLGSSYVQNIRQLIYFKINEQKSKQIILVAVYRAIYIVSIKTKPSPTLAAAAAKSLQSCPTLHVAIDGSPPGSPVPRILQARTLE